MLPWRPVFPVRPVAPAEAGSCQAACYPLESHAGLPQSGARMWMVQAEKIYLCCPGGRYFPSALWLLQKTGMHNGQRNFFGAEHPTAVMLAGKHQA